MEQLTVHEAGVLQQCESIIERGLKTFVEVGNALMAIRDDRLYRTEFKTFEDYCQERWNIARRTAHQLMGAAEVVENVRNCAQIPATESQARPLTRLDPEDQPIAWQRAVETAPNGKVTAAHVENTVKEYTSEKSSPHQFPSWVPAEPEPTPKPVGSMAVHYSSERPDWETPQDLFDLLDQEFGFTLDVCALPQTAKCASYFTPDDDGLAQDWTRHVCWMNPPYGDEIPDWVSKAYEQAQKGAMVVCLVPARVDTGWWWDNCIHGEIRFLKGRLKFKQEGCEVTSAPFPSAVVVFSPNVAPSTVWWDWRTNVRF